MLLLVVVLAQEGRGQGFLHTEGQKIVDGRGQQVILRGMGLGGWMLQEGYMLKTSGPQHELEARIRALIGPERTEVFYEAWLANHTRKVDIDSMAAWGYNAVRLPMHYKLFTPPVEEEPVLGEITWRDKGFEMVDALLEWVGTNEMYLILDLHAAPGGQGKNADISDYNPAKPSLWESEANREKTVALWRKLAERYADEPWIGGYDIINEPNWGFQNIEDDPNGCAETNNEPLWELQREITDAIREVDRNHMVIIEGNCWGNNYAELPPLWDDNMVVSFHKYWNFNDRSSIQWVLDMREERNVPVWMGESGENSNTWFANAIQLIEANGIGWAMWPLKKLGFNNPLEIRPSPGYERVLAYWNDDEEKPDEDEAFQVLMQLTENLKLENNVYHRDVVDAMIRQPHSSEVLPFKEHVISATDESRVWAVDYDLGRHGGAYHDADTADHHVATDGDWVRWNHGRVYRNDGVDIVRNNDGAAVGYHVSSIEPGEWLQYTVDVERGGDYTLRLVTAATEGGGRVSLSLNDEIIQEDLSLPVTGGNQSWQSTGVRGVPLETGTNRVRIIVGDGGFALKGIVFARHDDPRHE